MKLSQEEQIKVIMERITEDVDVTPGGGQGGRIIETRISARKLAEFLFLMET